MDVYVGIDIAKDKHNCCIMDETQSILHEFVFLNSREGFDRLLSNLMALSTPENSYIGLEATGVYGENLCAFLRRNGFELTTFNPLSVKKRLQATTLRKTKTDVGDARFLAYIMTQGNNQSDAPLSYHISELKSLSRKRFFTVQKRSGVKNQINAILSVTFPEFLKAFSDPYGASALAVLNRYSSPQELVRCRTATLTSLLAKASRGSFGRDKAIELKTLAAASIGTHSDAKILELSFALQELALYTEQISILESEIEKLMALIDSPVTTVPGIGTVLGAMIVSEIGSFKRFSSPDKLLAFAGLDPSVYQSGKFIPSSGTMLKRGSPYLRWALIQSARLVSRFSPAFRNFLDKKLSEGKHYSVATVHVAKKLVRVLFALSASNSTFSLDFPS